jgi:hypothetical protein
MKHNFCICCHYCDTDRKNEKHQVRCTRYSRFVNPMDISCDGFLAKNSGILREFYEAITRRKDNG